MDREKELLDAAIRLLRERDDPLSITSRDIGRAAKVNPAMINYYYGSKNALIMRGVYAIMETTKEAAVSEKELPAKERLRKYMACMGDDMARYEKLVRVVVPNLMLNLPLGDENVLGMVREHYGGSASEQECRLKTFQLIYTLVLAFYRKGEASEYLRTDLTDPDKAREWTLGVVDSVIDRSGRKTGAVPRRAFRPSKAS